MKSEKSKTAGAKSTGEGKTKKAKPTKGKKKAEGDAAKMNEKK
jgi:hypothetical protein